MDKVYVVVIDDVYDFECTSKFKVFKNSDDAKKYFDSVVSVFKIEHADDYNSAMSVIEGDESKGMFTWYEAGTYSQSRFEVTIVEKEVH